MNTTNNGTAGTASRLLSVFTRGVLPLIVIAAGILGAVQLIKTAPQAKQRSTDKSATLVKTRSVAPQSDRTVIHAMGTVIAARQIVLQPQVSGIVRKVHPALVPGGRINSGDEIAVIERTDYEVAVRQAQAALDRAKAHLLSAELELERLEGLRTHRATNKKELDNAHTAHAAALADVAAAEAALEKANLDLSRTVLRAPFSCVVVAESIDVGSLVSSQTQIATLVATDEYWVRASIPVNQLRWVDIASTESGSGSPARVSQRLGTGAESQWQGRVIRLLSDLEPQGRMARVLISIPDPLEENGADRVRQPLLMGAYVDVAIQGRELHDVFSLARDELRDGDRVWLMNADDELEIRAVSIVFRGRQRVLIDAGLTAGESIVVSKIPSPVAGMTLKAMTESVAEEPADRSVMEAADE